MLWNYLAGDQRPYMGEDRPVVGALVLRHHPDGKFRVFNLIINRDLDKELLAC